MQQQTAKHKIYEWNNISSKVEGYA